MCGYYPLCLTVTSILNDVVEGRSGLIQYHKIPIVHPRLTVGGIPRISRVRMVADLMSLMSSSHSFDNEHPSLCCYGDVPASV